MKTLTGSKGVTYVNFQFEEGYHATPGTYFRSEHGVRLWEEEGEGEEIE